MSTNSGYDLFMRRLLAASGAVFSLILVSTLWVSDAHAQINGPPASVTSPGFGGRAINGPPASVTSVGPRGYGNGQFFSPFNAGGVNARIHNGEFPNGRHHHQNSVLPYTPYLTYAYPVPYAVDMGGEAEGPEEAAPPEAEEPYQGGPTVFDRRGYGSSSYVPPSDMKHSHHAEQHAEQSEEPASPPEPLEPTTLVFKDGHKLEVGNYAIVGPTLFDMTPGHARKVPLKDLDLEATRRENDEHGVMFQLPLSSKAN
jgi:hypothetical protein